MATEQRNTIPGDNTPDRIAPNAASGNQSISDKSANMALSLAQQRTPASTSSAQPSLSRPLWNTGEGRITAYKRMIKKNHLPEQRANFEALICYYEDGGKVPQGQEELWAFDGQASFGIRKYTHINQMPEGWLYKLKYCDSSKNHQMNYVPKPDEYTIADRQGRVVLEDE